MNPRPVCISKISDASSAVLQELVDKGSTVLVIEHNMDLVKVADWVIDLGPGRGPGWRPSHWTGISRNRLPALLTPTGLTLKNTLEKQIALFLSSAAEKREPPDQSIRIKNAQQNNLKNISLSIPAKQNHCFNRPFRLGQIVTRL